MYTDLPLCPFCNQGLLKSEYKAVTIGRVLFNLKTYNCFNCKHSIIDSTELTTVYRTLIQYSKKEHNHESQQNSILH